MSERSEGQQERKKGEGSLEAPIRHPIRWKEPGFYDEAALNAELARVFDGCRRCVSLCNAFPTLFDLVDNSPTLEVDGVDKAHYPKVVEQCYLCDLCYMTKCPYVPPHPWNIDFPHLMLRAKAHSQRAGRTRTRDRIPRRHGCRRPHRHHPGGRRAGECGDPEPPGPPPHGQGLGHPSRRPLAGVP